MIFVVKASEYPSPSLVCSLSSAAKTIKRKERGMKGGGGAKEGTEKVRGLCRV